MPEEPGTPAASTIGHPSPCEFTMLADAYWWRTTTAALLLTGCATVPPSTGIDWRTARPSTLSPHGPVVGLGVGTIVRVDAPKIAEARWKAQVAGWRGDTLFLESDEDGIAWAVPVQAIRKLEVRTLNRPLGAVIAAFAGATGFMMGALDEGANQPVKAWTVAGVVGISAVGAVAGYWWMPWENWRAVPPHELVRGR